MIVPRAFLERHMLLRISPQDDAERARREFTREKRSSAYMVVFSILFAFTIQSLAKWLYEQITMGPASARSKPYFKSSFPVESKPATLTFNPV